MKRFIVAVVMAMVVIAPCPLQAYPHGGGGYGGGGYYGHGGGYYGGYHGGYCGHGGYYGGWGWGWPAAAFATGALLGSAYYYSRPYYYYGDPGYYADAPVYRTRVVHSSSQAQRSGLELDVQAALRTKGYYTGSLDGIYGPQTADAIRRFQVDNGLVMTGKINGDTLKALGL